jgi:hypothetical protein
VNSVFVKTVKSTLYLCVISGIRRAADETCGLMGYTDAILDAFLHNALQNITKSVPHTHTFFENELSPTTAIQQRQNVDVVGCCTCLSGLISMLAFVLCKFPMGDSNLHPPPSFGYGPADETMC